MNPRQAKEIAIRVLNEFEELLAGKGIMIPSDDREGRDEEACIYGSEYFFPSRPLFWPLFFLRGSGNSISRDPRVGTPTSSGLLILVQ